MKRIALDSLPTNRRHLLSALWKFRKQPLELEKFTKETGLAPTTARRGLNDLCVLGVVVQTMRQITAARIKTKKYTTQKAFYQLSEQFREYGSNVGGIPPT